ncbi:MAG: hypothetical protein HQ504_09075 [Rhodospirillaceae bacterium]|nr:hypothetical protein [Rhodospirillaceae bacterium]
MQIDKTDGAAAAAQAGTGQTNKAPEQAGTQEEASLIERIRKLGFSAFVAQIEAEKRAEMRAEILTRMGLTEESLAEMPAEQRAAIEDAVAEAIRLRMMAQSAVEESTEGDKTVAGTAIRSGSVSALIPVDGGQRALSGMGFDVMQAIEALDRDPLDKSAEKDRHKG